MARHLKVGSDFALLDVKTGHKEMNAALAEGKRINVVLRGIVDCAWGEFDGVSQEFSVDVTSVLVIEGHLVEGLILPAREKDPTP